MTSTPLIRPPLPGDAEAMAWVHNTGWRETYSHILPERFYDAAALGRRQEMWRRILADPGERRLAVAEDAGEIVGLAMAGPAAGDDADRGHPARELELNVLYVRPGHHGTGAGQALLDAVIGSASAQLWVAEDNARARAFYTRNGFHPDGARNADEEFDGAEIRMVR